MAIEGMPSGRTMRREGYSNYIAFSLKENLAQLSRPVHHGFEPENIGPSASVSVQHANHWDECAPNILEIN